MRWCLFFLIFLFKREGPFPLPVILYVCKAVCICSYSAVILLDQTADLIKAVLLTAVTNDDDLPDLLSLLQEVLEVIICDAKAAQIVRAQRALNIGS